MSVKRLLRNGLRYWRAHGTRHLLRELQRRLSTPVPPGMGPMLMPEPAGRASHGNHELQHSAQPARALLQARFAALSPLQTYPSPKADKPRISVVTDSLNQGSFFGGVATSLILAVQLARRRGARLRIVTRNEPVQGNNLTALFELYGLGHDLELEFAMAHVSGSPPSLDVQPDELFLTTSWWTTHATLASVPLHRVLYLLQEDERMFYPSGEEQLRCHQVLNRPGLRLVINTSLLMQHLQGSGVAGLADRAIAFEPAFPEHVFHPRPRPQAAARRRLMFYARPVHLRNLFYFGLELLERAIGDGMLDTNRWELHFVGSSIPAVTLCDGTAPVLHEQLGWQPYAELAGTMDLAICLMNTPHPSYPPLDLAASGAVVLSNCFGNKTDLSPLCANILLAELDLAAMLGALKSALALAEDDAERQRRHAARRIGGSWDQALAVVADRYSQRADAWA